MDDLFFFAEKSQISLQDRGISAFGNGFSNSISLSACLIFYGENCVDNRMFVPYNISV